MRRTSTLSIGLATVLAASTFLAGCGEQPDDAASMTSSGHHEQEPNSDGDRHSAGTHVMPDGTLMKDSEMGGMNGMSGGGSGTDDAAGPSAAARMICGPGTREAVAKTLGLDRTPAPLDSWADQTYRCTYQLPGGDLRLQVEDLTEAAAGRAWFDDLVQRLDATKIVGMESLGFPAYQTADGDVVFLKDHKTLWVDATRLSDAALPAGMTRTETAYGVAAAVVACWTEHH